MHKVKVKFTGKVQGVFFRANCQKKAVELGVSGWVRNLPDGQVEMVGEGAKVDLEELIDWCRTSQPFAIVTSLDQEWSEGAGEYMDFKIIR